MSEDETLKERAKRERAARAKFLREKRALEKEARAALDTFAASFSQARPTKKDSSNQEEPVVSRQVTVTAEARQPELPPKASPKPDKGIPLEFYCYVDGKIGVVNIYAMSDPIVT